MKLAEHKMVEMDCFDYIDGLSTYCPHYKSDEDCKGECPLIHAEDCPRCKYQIPLLQQIVDGLRERLLKVQGMQYWDAVNIAEANILANIIKEYEAIIEGSNHDTIN